MMLVGGEAAAASCRFFAGDSCATEKRRRWRCVSVCYCVCVLWARVPCAPNQSFFERKGPRFPRPSVPGDVMNKGPSFVPWALRGPFCGLGPAKTATTSLFRWFIINTNVIKHFLHFSFSRGVKKGTQRGREANSPIAFGPPPFQAKNPTHPLWVLKILPAYFFLCVRVSFFALACRVLNHLAPPFLVHRATPALRLSVQNPHPSYLPLSLKLRGIVPPTRRKGVANRQDPNGGKDPPHVRFPRRPLVVSQHQFEGIVGHLEHLGQAIQRQDGL